MINFSAFAGASSEYMFIFCMVRIDFIKTYASYTLIQISGILRNKLKGNVARFYFVIVYLSRVALKVRYQGLV